MDLYIGFKHFHLLTVVLFLLSLVIKTILLFINKEKFIVFKRKTKIPEMIVTILFLITGIIMITMKDGKFNYLLWVKIGLIVVSIPVAVVAFKKQYKYLALIATFLFIMVYGLAEMAGKKAYVNNDIEISKDLSGTAKHGEKLYQLNCTTCHGKLGDKGLGKASNLQKSQLDDNAIKQIIMKGKNNMPAYNQLTEHEVEALKEYVLTLRVED